jgi:hypothetical protein
MRPGVSRIVLAAACLLSCSLFLHAQQEPSITVRLLDGKTGVKVDASNVLVQFDHHQQKDGNWSHQNDDGTIQVRIPPGAVVISVHATYDNAMEFYINCDVAKQKNTEGDTWYPISDILKSGIAMPNDCVKEKNADKIRVDPKQGEFVVYVRRRGWREQD